MADFLELLSYSFAGNTIRHWLMALSLAVVCYNVLWALKLWLSQLLHRFLGRLNYFFIKWALVLVNSVSWVFIVAISLYIGSLQLQFWGSAKFILKELPLIACLFQIGYWGSTLIDYKLGNLIETKPNIQEKKQLQTIATPIKYISTGVLWILLLLTCMANLGINVTAFIAGLGIGGIAVALAVQSTLSDLLASISIGLGKPFMVGDFIILDTAMGTVEDIGLKTTRMRSLGGEMVIIPNSQLMTSRVINCNNMTDRRVVFAFSVRNNTKTEDLRKVPAIIKEAVLSQEKTRFDRAHFARFGLYTYDFEVVYFIQNPDFNFYMDTQQGINLRIVEALEEAGISLFYPVSEITITKSKTG